MSHVTTLKIEIRDLQALKDACKKLGLVFKENQKTYRWFGRFVGDYREAGTDPKDMGKCDHAIGLPNNAHAYEIGVAKQGDKYVLRYDFWSGGMGLEAVVGKKCSNLTEAYTQVVAVKEVSRFAKAQGWTLTQDFDQETNETVIKLRKY